MTAAPTSVPLISSPLWIICTEEWGKGDNIVSSIPPLLEAHVGSTRESIPLLPCGRLSVRSVQWYQEQQDWSLTALVHVEVIFNPRGCWDFLYKLLYKMPHHKNPPLFFKLAWADILIKNYQWQYIAGHWKPFLCGSFSAQILLCGCGHMFEWLGSQADVHSTVFILFRWLWEAAQMHWCWQRMWGEPDSWQHLHFSGPM